LNPSLFPNRLDLKYIVGGNRIRFEVAIPDPLVSEFDPVIHGEFAVQLRLSLIFDTEVDGSLFQANVPPAPSDDPPGAPYLRGPAKVILGSVGFAEGRFTSNYDPLDVTGVVVAPKLREAEAELNSTTESLPADILSLRELNIELYKGANSVRRFLPDAGELTPFFYIETLPRENDYVIRFVRPVGRPQPLTGCRCDSSCDSQISCACAGVGLMENGERLLLQKKQRDDTWVSSGNADTWSVHGSALGAGDGEDVTVRLCLVNTWGRGCGGPITFRYRDWGSCGSNPPDPTPTPICPDGLHPCACHGCLAPGMECTPCR
jgi:hypothetical protein